MAVCASCGEENPKRFRFCGRCGMSPVPAAPLSGEERKVVSALFVEGARALLAEADDPLGRTLAETS